MKKYKTGFLVGRFQPFHKGHLYLINKSLQAVDRLIIGVGSANVKDINNPLSYDQRKEMLETVIENEKLIKKIIKIVPLDDFHNDEKWFNNCINQIGQIDIVIGNNEWVNGIFEKRNYKILRVGFFKRYLYEGEKIRKLMKLGKEWENRVPKYLIPEMKSYKFRHIALGGTFDHFHKGHKKIIDTAFENGEKVSIGITEKVLHNYKLLNEAIEDFETRKKSVINYLKSKKYLDRAELFTLLDIYGPTKTDKTIEALVVSKETFDGALKINNFRKKIELSKLTIIIVEDVKADDQTIITSKRIRMGEIDREGNSYQLSVFSIQKKTLILPKYLRSTLRKPIGKIYKTTDQIIVGTNLDSPKKPVMVIAVGDIVSKSLEDAGFIPDVKIIDFMSRRKKVSLSDNLKDYSQPIYVQNKSGTINYSSVDAIRIALNKFTDKKEKQAIIVDGEEDLLALPAILLAPLGSIILYGQMDLGVVVVEVTEKIKKDVLVILDKFNSD